MSVAASIRDKLTSAFAPIALEVTDESARHAGHAGATRDDGSRGETHFHVRLVSAAFEGVSRVERQRRAGRGTGWSRARLFLVSPYAF